MSETKPYRLKPGLQHGSNPKVQGGAIVELTERQALAWADKFEALEGEAVGVSPASPRSPAQSPASAAAPIDAGELVAEVKGTKASDLIAQIGKAGADTVRAIAEAEAFGKARATVLRAADDRLDELEG